MLFSVIKSVVRLVILVAIKLLVSKIKLQVSLIISRLLIVYIKSDPDSLTIFILPLTSNLLCLLGFVTPKPIIPSYVRVITSLFKLEAEIILLPMLFCRAFSNMPRGCVTPKPMLPS